MCEVQVLKVRDVVPPCAACLTPCLALHCSCKAVGMTQKQLTVRQLPPVLCLHLKRFEVVAQAGSKAQVSSGYGANGNSWSYTRCIWAGMT